MSTDNDAMDFLMSAGSKIPSAKFLTVGTVHKGQVLAMEKSQQTAYKSDKLLFWDDGKPRWQIVFTLQTDENDEDVEDDDGLRRIFAKGKMLAAIKEAVEASGYRSGSLVGGKLAVKYVANGEAKDGMNPPHLFAAKFEAPEATTVADLGVDEDEYADTEPF